MIYLDAAASAPIAPEAMTATIEAMHAVGNPSAAHAAGREATARVDQARGSIAELIHAGPAAVTFVGSATEANNLAIRGVLPSGGHSRIVTSTTEHPSVLATVRDIADHGNDAVLIKVDGDGQVDIAAATKFINSNTTIVSIHAANNETGVIQPIEQVADIAHHYGALLHVDASQLMAWGECAMLDSADLITISSHKMHGPQGAAALIVRPPARTVIRPQFTGGGQERGLRSGTVNVAAVAGFGAAAGLALASGETSGHRIRSLRARLLDGISAITRDLVEHSAGAEQRLPGILNVAFDVMREASVESEALLARMPNVAATTGSACHAGAPGQSPTLLAMGISPWVAARSVRFSLSRYTTNTDIDCAIGEIAAARFELMELTGSSDSNERTPA